MEEKHTGINPQGKTTPVESFIMKPYLQPFLGVTVTKDTDIDDVTEDGTVHQIIKGTTFTTEAKHEAEKDGLKISEESKLVVEVPEGTVLIYQPGQGYVVPEMPFTTIDNLKEDLNLLVDNEGKSL